MRHCLLALGFFILAAPADAADVDALLARIKAVKPEGDGNAEAQAAWKELVQQGPAALPAIFAAIDEKNALAGNWLRNAVDAIAEREQQAKRPLPAKELEAVVRDTKHAPRARRLAYEWLLRADPAAPARLLPGMLHDPSSELRRDAVALFTKEATALLAQGKTDDARRVFEKALGGACDRDQVDAIARHLKPLGVTVDLARHFGYIQKWQLVGPFEHSGGVGYKAVYPPEEKLDLAAKYKGKKEAELAWKDSSSADPYGVIDFNKSIAKHMGAVGYAYTPVVSAREQTVVLRLGTPNAVKVYLNGKLVFQHEEYHHGFRVDQYSAPITLKAGRNDLLVKVCQNEQTDNWAQTWAFQLRITDSVGAAAAFEIAGQ